MLESQEQPSRMVKAGDDFKSARRPAVSSSDCLRPPYKTSHSLQDLSGRTLTSTRSLHIHLQVSLGYVLLWLR